MWLEDWYDSLDSSEWWVKSQETAKEAQEKKDRYSKWMTWVQRTRKDEKKAHRDNDILYSLIVDILKDNHFDTVVPLLVDMLKIWAPSNLIIWAMSLIFDKAVYVIRNCYREVANKIMIIDNNIANNYKVELSYERSTEVIEFDDNNINSIIKDRINSWIEDIIYVISFDPSTIVTTKFFDLIKVKENREIVINLIAWTFTFFLYDLNIIITKDKAFLYSEYILEEVIKKLKTVTLEEV